MSEQRKRVARAEFEVWSTGDLDELDALVAPDVVHHDPHDPNASRGLEGLKKTITTSRAAFPDMQITIEDQIAEGDKVATRWTATMTHRSGLGDANPRPKPVTMTGTTIVRFEGDKIVEAWRSMDMLGLLSAIGALPSER